MISPADELLAALEPLPHAARLRHTAVTAHRLAAGGGLRPLLAALDARGPYERRLAALGALAAGELDHLAARLGDPDPVVRRYALRAARRPAFPDGAVEAAYDDAPAVVRADLARLLRTGRRPELAERLVLRVRAEYGVRDAARLLAGCSPEFTARLLSELAEGLAGEDWSTLAVRHPLAVLGHAERTLAGLNGRLRDGWWRLHGAAIAAALPSAPARTLDLLVRYGPRGLPGPVHDRLGELVAVDAERVTRWFADPGRSADRWERTPGRAVMRQLVAADPPSLPRLAARWIHRTAFTTLLLSVPPAGRARFLDAVVAVAPFPLGIWSSARVLALLPAGERHVRARAAVEKVRAERGSVWDLWHPLALLPPAEAQPQLLAALATNDPDERGTVWDRLVANASGSRDPEQVVKVLALAASRLGKERDPVRQEALAAIADVPAPLLVTALRTGTPGETAPASDALRRLCLDALNARDCSSSTRDTIGGMAVGLLAAAAQTAGDADTVAAPVDGTGTAAEADDSALRTAAHIVEALTAHTGRVELGPPGSLRPRVASTVLDALGTWLDRAAARRDVTPLLALVTSCGRDAQRLAGLQVRIEEALRTCPDDVFDEVAAAWLADRANRGDRVAELLAWEPGAAFLPSVLAVLAADRTDLLDRALTETTPPGRFPVAGAARPLPPFRYADRWLPRQQRAAVRLAAAAIGDCGRGLDERAALLRAVAPVPHYGRTLLRRHTAASGSAEPALRAAALDAAAHTDEPAAALDALLELAGDDEAATAWSAAGRAAAHARPARLAALLGDVLTREAGVKVTVRKSAARLAARHLPPGSATALLSTVARTPGVHPDVRDTVLGLATGLLPDERMWALLESAATDGPSSARHTLLNLGPADLAPAHRSRYGELLARLARARQPAEDKALSHLQDWAGYAPGAGRVLAEVCLDLSAARMDVLGAASGLRDLARSGLPHPVGGVEPGSLLHGVVDGLLAHVAAGEAQGGGPVGDLPARRRLRSLVGSTIGDHRLCAALARQLTAEPAVTSLRADLLVRAIDLDASEAELRLALRELTAAIGGRPVLAARMARTLEEAHRYGGPPADPAAALSVVRALGMHGGLVEGLLAVALATALGIRQGWPAPGRAAVVELRGHPEAEVREAAYATDLSGD
ncbi:hypothetical protein ACWGNF_02590 [Streptomyces sp. NPDC055808]